VDASTSTLGVLTCTPGRSRPPTDGGLTRTEADGTRTRATGAWAATGGGETGGRVVVPPPP
jgi:hypothetical protein